MAFSLANQAGAAFRAALNVYLAALQADSYGATEPSDRVPGMVWVDASGAVPVVKRRNAANDAWIDVGRLEADDTFTLLALQAVFGSNSDLVIQHDGATTPTIKALAGHALEIWADTLRIKSADGATEFGQFDTFRRLGLVQLGRASIGAATTAIVQDVPTDCNGVLILGVNLQPVSNNETFLVRIGQNGAAGAFESGTDYSEAFLTVIGNTNQQTFNFNETEWRLTMRTGNTRRAGCVAAVLGLNTAGAQPFGVTLGGGRDGSGDRFAAFRSLIWDGAAASYNALRLFVSSGDFAAGEIVFIGIRS